MMSQFTTNLPKWADDKSAKLAEQAKFRQALRPHLITGENQFAQALIAVDAMDKTLIRERLELAIYCAQEAIKRL